MKKNSLLIVILLLVGVFILSLMDSDKLTEEEKDNLPHDKSAYAFIDIKDEDRKESGYLNENGLKKVESSLVLDNYGLYLGDDISIDKINNAYLIAFNIKKYLSVSLSSEKLEKIYTFVPENANWKWDKCFSNRCNDLTNYKYYYRITKDEFNNFMHKTYNTKNNYDIFSVNEEETVDIVDYSVIIDSTDNYYTMFYNPDAHSGINNKIKTQIIDSKEDDEYLYLYNKFIVCDIDAQGSSCERSMSGLDYENAFQIVNCVGDDPKCEIENAIKNNYDKLDTYKHTFKKENGKYYWVKSEVVESTD